MASSSAALNAPAATAMRSLWSRHHSQRGLRRQEPRHEASAHGRPIIIIIITATNRRLEVGVEVEVSREGLGVSGALGFGGEQDDGEGLM